MIALVATPALAQDDAEVTWRGPLRVRTQFPLDLITLDQTPESARLGKPWGWSLEVGVVHANTYEVTPGYAARVGKYQSGQYEPGWDFEVDDEATRLHARLDWTLGEAVEIGVEVPFLSHDGGFMDSFIDDIHDTVGTPDNGRKDAPEDAFNVDFISGSDRFRVTDEGAALGDVTLHAKVALVRGERGAFSALLEAKAPTGDEGELTGSGEWDYGVGLLVSAGTARHVFHGGVSHYLLGEPEHLPFVIEDRTSVFLGYEWAASERWSLAVQALGATSLLPDDPDNRNDSERAEVHLGAHYGSERWQLSFGIIENLTTNDNTSDFGVFLASKWSS